MTVADSDAIWEDAEADEVTANAGFEDLAFDGVDFEMEFGFEIGFDRFSIAVEFVAIVAEEGEVIDVADVAFGLELFEDVVVKAAEVEVGEELASEVADRDSGGAWRIRIYLRAVVDDAIDQP